MTRYSIRLVLLFCLANLSTVYAQSLSLPRIFGDNMILQREMEPVIWGQASPNSTVYLTIGKKTVTCVATQTGHWKTRLPALKAGVGYTLSIKSGNEVRVFNNIAVGDVYYAGGQSNMQFNLEAALNGPEEVAKANYKNIRLFTVSRTISSQPQSDLLTSTEAPLIENQWLECTPQSAKNFSAVAYFFARKIHVEEGIPVGIINVSWGGTPIETHSSLAANKQLPYARLQALEIENNTITEKLNNQQPASVFNAMIAPIVPYSINGFLWYQGEHNWNYPCRYREQLKVFINDMRIQWQQGYLPFYIIQLPNMGKRPVEPVADFWSVLRESQMAALELPNTEVVVTQDAGDGDLHPKNKLIIGERLALIAQKNIYGKNLVAKGPFFESFRVSEDTVEVSFTNQGLGLSHTGDSIVGFALAGNDQQFRWARATIKGNKVRLTAKGVPHPVAVRYGWGENPINTLTNEEGFPAYPFRTDQWPVREDGTW